MQHGGALWSSDCQPAVELVYANPFFAILAQDNCCIVWLFSSRGPVPQEWMPDTVSSSRGSSRIAQHILQLERQNPQWSYSTQRCCATAYTLGLKYPISHRNCDIATMDPQESECDCRQSVAGGFRSIAQRNCRTVAKLISCRIMYLLQIISRMIWDNLSCLAPNLPTEVQNTIGLYGKSWTNPESYARSVSSETANWQRRTDSNAVCKKINLKKALLGAAASIAVQPATSRFRWWCRRKQDNRFHEGSSSPKNCFPISSIAGGTSGESCHLQGDAISGMKKTGTSPPLQLSAVW